MRVLLYRNCPSIGPQSANVPEVTHSIQATTTSGAVNRPYWPPQGAKYGHHAGMSPGGRILDPPPTLTYCFQRSYAGGDDAEGRRPALERAIRSLERVMRSAEWAVRSLE